MTRIIYRLLDILIFDSTDTGIAFGCILGFHLGLIPVLTIQWMLAFFCLVLFRVNFLSVLCVGLFSFGLSEVLEPVFHRMGLKILTGFPGLYSLWGWMHHMPIVPFTGFNNTVVLGSTLTVYILSLPLFLICLKSLVHIRSGVSHLWYTTKMSRSYSHYARKRKNV